MGDNTAIEWTDATWTPIRARETRTGKIGWHCEHASDGCRFCYAEAINKRLGTGFDFKPGHLIKPFGEVDGVEVFLDEKMLLAPLKWKKPRMIFVCSMTDAFGDFVEDAWLDKMFAVMALSPQHTFQVLTKRAGRMRDYFTRRLFRDVHPLEVRGDAIDAAMNDIAPAHWCKRELADYSPDGLPLPNVWLGVSAERQKEADERIPQLLATPAAVRFISAEPLLGPINLENWLHNPPNGQTGCGLNWVIVGGESGKDARPMHPAWARSLRGQCAAADVPFFFKQHGEWREITEEDMHSVPPERFAGAPHDFYVVRVGKKRAGRILDGVEHNGMPERAA